jgi:hypothetical protein
MNENRSPAFAPNFEQDDVESMRVITAGYPAEYGRKLGGVVELSSPKDTPAGFRGDASMGGGSFGSVNGSLGLAYRLGRNTWNATGFGARSDRYLDPPVLANFSNSGSSGGGSASYARDFTDRDRLRVFRGAQCISKFPMNWCSRRRDSGRIAAILKITG